MHILYLDLVGGIAGDMWLAAFLDLGLSVDALNDFLKILPGKPEVYARRVTKAGLSALKIEIKTKDDLFPKTYSETMAFLEKLSLDEEIKKKARKIFQLLFETEAKVHGQPLEEIHLHELAAGDTMVDILGVLFALKTFKIAKIYVSPIPLGSGLITSAHGPLPLPAPATLYLLHGYEVYGIEEPVETVTPTGVVLIRALTEGTVPFPQMTLKQIGIGAGSQDFKTRPNILRLFLGEIGLAEGLLWEEVVELETNLDDETPEVLAHAAENLLKAGALDVGFLPFLMKKGRLGHKLVVLAQPGRETRLAQMILTETGSLGVRIRKVMRLIVPREIKELTTPWGSIKIKVAYFPGEREFIKPEWEDMKRLAQKTGRPLREIIRDVLSLYLKGD